MGISDAENPNGLNKEQEVLSEEEHSSWKFWKKRRYIVAFLAFLGFFNVYALRVNLSIAIVAMTDKSDGKTPEFDWDSKMQGLVLSSFFYGYITTQLVGGYVAGRIGGKKVYGCGIAVTAVLTVLTPWMAKTSIYLLIAVRIIEGIFEGVSYPCIHAVWSKWAPPLERSRLATIAFSGSYVGTVVAMPSSAYLSDAFGWPSIFYCFGTIAIIWFLVWMVVVAETPEDDPHISPAELKYITESLKKNSNSKTPKVPWRDIVTSMPVWAIVCSHFSENWGFYTLLTLLPKFMKDVLKFELGTSGFMSAVPYLAMAIMISIAGHFADLMQVKKILTTTQVRRYFNCSGFIAQTVFMLGAAYAQSTAVCMVCLTLAVGLGAFAWAGFSVNHLDIAPQFAGLLMGFSNTFATLPGILSPIIAGYIVTTPTAEEWRIVFFISSGVYLFGSVFYFIFVSGELQPWAMDETPSHQNQIPIENGCQNKAYVQTDEL